MRWSFVFLLFILSITSISAVNITGESITGKPMALMSMNITILASPALTLISPKNGTYFMNASIPLDYSLVLDSYSSSTIINYSLDAGKNITITSPIYFNASEGSHILYLYANNNFNITSRNVTFFVNSSKFNIIDDKWTGSEKGNSTNFTILSYQEIQNLSNVILENINYGKILFNQNINLTDNMSNNQIDISSNINISENRIELNSTALPNLNKSATIWIYNLSFSNPRILRDGTPCPDSICTNQSYSSGNLRFDVTQFSIYSAEETPVTPPVSGGGGGGGGGGSPSTQKSFSIDKSEIKEKIDQGRIITEEIVITNKIYKTLSFEINVSNLENFLIINETQFQLSPGQSKTITIKIIADKETAPNLYMGKINVIANGETQEILTAIEVQSASPLFDVSVTIPSKYAYVMPNEEILSQIEIYNLGELEKEIDVNMEYRIVDEKGNEILKQSEEIAIDTKISFIKSFIIPADAKFGRYAVYAKAIYKDKVASGSAWFNVGTGIRISWWQWLIIFGIIILIILIIIILIIKRIKIKSLKSRKEKYNKERQISKKYNKQKIKAGIRN